MNKKKAGSAIMIGILLLMILISSVYAILSQKINFAVNNENRELASKPELTIDNYGTYADEFEAYYNDRIPFRSQLITLNSAIDYYVFHRSSSDDVILGKNKWLFYSSVSDGDSVADYQGTNLFTEEELQKIADNCVAQRDFLAARGVEFVICVCPNKERIYSEYMPEKYGKPAETYRTGQVVDYLRANTDLRIVYSYDKLMEEKQLLEQNLYYKSDTHWNRLGAYVGAQALLEELGVTLPDLHSEEIIIRTGENTAGDLAGILSLTEQLKKNDCEYKVKGYDTHNVQKVESDFNKVFRFTAENADSRKLYMVRDSFCTAMQDYLGSQFNDSCFRHYNTYCYADFLAEDPDILVYEVVERNVDAMESFSVTQEEPNLDI